jgi:hypothetical protein
VASAADEKQTVPVVRGLQLSDRLGAKVTTSSVLDRLGVKKVTLESNLPLLRVTDRLGDKTVPPTADKLCSRKVISVRSEGLAGHADSKQDVSASGGRGTPGSRRSVSMIPQSERCNAPTAVKGTSRLMDVSMETEPLGPKVMHRSPDEDGATSRDQVRVKRKLMGMFRRMGDDFTQTRLEKIMCNKRFLLRMCCLCSTAKLMKLREIRRLGVAPLLGGEQENLKFKL